MVSISPNPDRSPHWLVAYFPIGNQPRA
jgi:hypothetical protein